MKVEDKVRLMLDLLSDICDEQPMFMAVIRSKVDALNQLAEVGDGCLCTLRSNGAYWKERCPVHTGRHVTNADFDLLRRAANGETIAANNEPYLPPILRPIVLRLLDSIDVDDPDAVGLPDCGQCGDKGYLLDQTYGYTDIPSGALPVQACNECRILTGDVQAAYYAAAELGSAWGGNFVPMTGDDDEDPIVACERLDRDGNHLGPIGPTLDDPGGLREPGPGDVWVWIPEGHELYELAQNRED